VIGVPVLDEAGPLTLPAEATPNEGASRGSGRYGVLMGHSLADLSEMSRLFSITPLVQVAVFTVIVIGVASQAIYPRTLASPTGR
jgi:multisubunit Na+/H+ antiporter MnhC subunit